MTLSARAIAATFVLAATGCASNAQATASVTRKQALAFARAVNLRPGDVSGFHNEPGSETDVMHALPQSKRKKCPGEPSTSTEVRSPLFLGPGEWELSSFVSVVASEQAAVAWVAVLKTERGLECLAPGLHGPNPPRVTMLPVELPTGAHFIAVRLGAEKFKGAPPRDRAYTDLLTVVVGQTFISLDDMRWGSPPPVATEDKLLALLYRRAEAHKL
jgi:hypothetical protein